MNPMPSLPSEAADALRALYAADPPCHSRTHRNEATRRVDGYMLLLALQGWALRAIGEPIGLTRERVRQRIVRAETEGAITVGLPAVPLLPPKPTPPVAPPRPRLRIRPDVAERLREMHAACRSLNGAARSDDPRRAIAAEFVGMVQSLIEQGVSVYQVAQVLGVTHLAVRSRLARYGYREPCPSMAGHAIKGRGTHERVSA